MAITRATGFPVHTSATGQSTQAVTPASVGDLLVLMGRSSALTPTVTGVSGGGVTTWAKAVDYGDTGNARYVFMWYGVVTTAGAATATITWSGANAVNVQVVADSFTTGASPPWQVASTAGQGSNGATATAIPCPSLTTDRSGDLYVGLARTAQTATDGGTSGFTYFDATTTDLEVFAPGLTSGQAGAPTWTTSVATNWQSIGALFATQWAGAPIVKRHSPAQRAVAATGGTF